MNRELCDTSPVYLASQMKVIYLKAEIRGEELSFLYSGDGEHFVPIGSSLDMKNISDERIEGNGFTGSMLGVNCCDLQGDGVFADFLFFDYREIDPE